MNPSTEELLSLIDVDITSNDNQLKAKVAAIAKSSHIAIEKYLKQHREANQAFMKETRLIAHRATLVTERKNMIIKRLQKQLRNAHAEVQSLKNELLNTSDVSERSSAPKQPVYDPTSTEKIEALTKQVEQYKQKDKNQRRKLRVLQNMVRDYDENAYEDDPDEKDHTPDPEPIDAEDIDPEAIKDEEISDPSDDSYDGENDEDAHSDAAADRDDSEEFKFKISEKEKAELKELIGAKDVTDNDKAKNVKDIDEEEAKDKSEEMDVDAADEDVDL